MTKLIINVSTGEISERELTDEELAQQLKDEAAKMKSQAEAQAKAAARQAILDRLGLNEEEVKLLLS